MHKHLTYSWNEHDLDASNIKDIIGNKGASLSQMQKMDIPVPPGFTISTKTCRMYNTEPESISHLWDEIDVRLKELEDYTKLKFGNTQSPLLLSVRSGAKVSMPGMMDTILNLGINDDIALASHTKDRRFMLDTYRRFIQMYGEVVMGLKSYSFESILKDHKRLAKIRYDNELDEKSLESLIAAYKKAIKDSTGADIPQAPEVQLREAIIYVFKSWINDRAIYYRKLHNIPNELGTAVNIQAMVFGNKDNNSATGVVFTRNLSTGNKELQGEFLQNAQGEDVVSGVKTPYPLSIANKKDRSISTPSMEEIHPKLFIQLEKFCYTLEEYYKEPQEIEFTIESGKLWFLQCRKAKYSGNVAIKIISSMLASEKISPKEAILQLKISDIELALHPTLDTKAPNYQPHTSGLPASCGAASGIIALSTQKILDILSEDPSASVILVRNETSPEDIEGMDNASGILTANGGLTSHAAVIARGMGKPCVCGASELKIDNEKNIIHINDRTLHEGDAITINGSNGDILLEKKEIILPTQNADLSKLLCLLDQVSNMTVRVNAETIKDINVGKEFGAVGIGLARTEHMFFAKDRINKFREAIVYQNSERGKDILQELELHQYNDFYKIFQTMRELPVTVRLLDPPLHEFFPSSKNELKIIAEDLKVNAASFIDHVTSMREINPMLGARGCRLSFVWKGIYEMQIRAILKAAKKIEAEGNFVCKPEIMVPFVTALEEIIRIKRTVSSISNEVMYHEYKFGTMIELPRTAILAKQIAQEVDFISFGTNDLTQTTLGISRDDSWKFMHIYQQKKIFENDPFVSLDTDGVGAIIAMAVKGARSVNSNISIGVCGEHGYDPKSIAFFHGLGLDYVSCSPYKVPIAKTLISKLS